MYVATAGVHTIRSYIGEITSYSQYSTPRIIGSYKLWWYYVMDNYYG